MPSVLIPFPAPMPIPADVPTGRADGGAAPGSPEPFPAELAALAEHHAAELRMITGYAALDDLIERTRDEASSRGLASVRAVAAEMLDPLLDLRERLEGRIAALAQAGAREEAAELVDAFDDMNQADALTEFRHLRPDQREALFWAQAQAAAVGGGEPPEAA